MFRLHISEEDIKTFMGYYRVTFPQATVLPKMHILEDHVVPWIRHGRVGFGFMGEQGAESIHAYFNSLKSSYRGIPDPVQQLRQMMVAHFLHVTPANIVKEPPLKKRKKEE